MFAYIWKSTGKIHKKKKFSLGSAKTNNLHFFSRKNFPLIRCRNMFRYEPNEESSFLIDIKWLPCFSHPQIVCEFSSSHARQQGSGQIMSQEGHQKDDLITHHSSFVHSLCLVSRNKMCLIEHAQTHARAHTHARPSWGDRSKHIKNDLRVSALI